MEAGTASRSPKGLILADSWEDMVTNVASRPDHPAIGLSWEPFQKAWKPTQGGGKSTTPAVEDAAVKEVKEVKEVKDEPDSPTRGPEQGPEQQALNKQEAPSTPVDIHALTRLATPVTNKSSLGKENSATSQHHHPDPDPQTKTQPQIQTNATTSPKHDMAYQRNQTGIIPCIMDLARVASGDYRGTLNIGYGKEKSALSSHFQPRNGPASTMLPSTRYVELGVNEMSNAREFEKCSEPDEDAVKSNNNGWFIEKDDTVARLEICNPIFIRRWAERLAPLPEATEINDVLYRSFMNNAPASGVGSCATIASSYFIDNLSDDGKLPTPEHWRCDVDTREGTMLQPYHHPTTMPALVPDFDLERKNWTAEFRRSEYVANGNRAGGERNAHLSALAPDTLSSLQSANITAPASTAPPIVTTAAPVNRSSCIIRPATPADMFEVARIYNAEVNGNGMAPDADEVDEATFHDILADCTEQGKPFIVAVRQNKLANPRAWPAEEAFQEYMSFCRETGHEIKDHIVGFSYLYPFDFGIWASQGNASLSAKIRCFVDPKHRCGGVGSSLLDMMLSFVVHNFSSKGGYEWRCGGNPGVVYNTMAAYNAKKYHRVFVEVYFKSSDDPNFGWVKDLLEKKFQFKTMGHIWQGYHVMRGPVAQWYDKVIWGMGCSHDDQVLFANAQEQAGGGREY